MSEYAKTIVKAEADRIRQELIAPGHVGMLYGEPIDMNDPDAVLVAAVWKAKHEEMLRGARSMDVMHSLRCSHFLVDDQGNELTPTKE